MTFPGISWQGHLGGLLGGALGAAMMVWSPARQAPRAWWQAAGFAAIAVLLVVAFVTRAAMLS